MPDSPSLVLASASQYKRRLLARLRVEFTSQPHDVDESRRRGETPVAMARRLAAAKAEAVASHHPDSYVLGADQVVALEDRIFDKPGSQDRAAEQLAELAGNTHRLVNSVALRHPDATLREATVVYQMIMRPLTDAQIQRYIQQDMPLDCAGAYKIEAGGIRLFHSTRGDDPTAIEGLPLTRVWSLLLDAGWTDD